MIRTHFGLRLSLGGGGVGTNGVAITLGDLIFYGLGTVITIDDATYLKAFRPVGNSDVAQVKGTSVLFDGTGYGTFTSPDTGAATSVLLPSTDWDEPIEFWFASGSVVAQETLLAGETTSTNEIVIRVSTNGQIATFFYLGAVFTGYMATVGIYDNALPHRVSLDYQGGIAYLTVDSEIVSAAWTLNGSQNVGFVGRRSDGVDPSTSTNMWGLSGPGFNLNVACGTDLIHPTVELSALLGGPNITWSGFASTIYREWSNGYGFDLNALGWTIADGSTMYLEDTHTTLLIAGSRIPPGAGFDGSGVALETQFPGPIAASMKTVGIPCIQGDVTGYVDLGSPLIPATADFDITAEYIPVESTATQVLVAQYTGGVLGRFTLGASLGADNKAFLHIGSAGSIVIEALNVQATGTLYKYRVTRVGDIFSLYVDGVLQGFLLESGVSVQQSENTTMLGYTASVSCGLGKFSNVSMDVSHHYPFEAGTGTIAEDTISGNNGVLTGFAGDPWSTRDLGRCLMRENGFTPDRLGVGTGISVCNTDGLHQDGSVPEFPRNTMENLYNAPVLHGPLIQAIALWTAIAQVDLTMIEHVTADQTFFCEKGGVIYSEEQDVDDMTRISRVLGCSGVFPFTFPFILG